MPCEMTPKRVHWVYFSEGSNQTVPRLMQGHNLTDETSGEQSTIAETQFMRLLMCGICYVENADEDHIYLMSEEAYAYFQAQVELYMPTVRAIWTPEEELQEARGDRRIPPENVNELEHLQNVIEFQCRSALCRKMELLGTALPGIAFAFGYVEQPEANPPT